MGHTRRVGYSVLENSMVTASLMSISHGNSSGSGYLAQGKGGGTQGHCEATTDRRLRGGRASLLSTGVMKALWALIT